MARILRIIYLVIWCVLCAGHARADKPAPLSPQTLKAPSGPASLKGLGESFSANPSTGTGSYSVPITLPPGFVVPAVSLSYTGGSGRSEVGVGFRMPVLQIYRLTDKGAAKFDETDRFAISGPEYNDELVLADPVKRVYRLKNEGAFILLQRDRANDRWLLLHPSGLRSVLGASTLSRSLANGQTCRWFVESTTDPFGHLASYRYFADQGKVYWQGVDYQREADVAYRNRVEFSYEARPDSFRDYRYGDLQQTSRRLKTIQVFQGARRLRQYTLEYQPSGIWSLLTGVTLEGENGLAMPRLTFGYLQPTARSGHFVRTQGFSTLTGLDTGRMTLEDVNGDGLPDLLNGQAGNYSYFENIDGQRFSSNAISLGSSGSPDRNLDDPGVVLADVDGDGWRDVWCPVTGGFRYFPGGRISQGQFLGYAPYQTLISNFVLSDVTRPEVRLMDLNGDGRTDALYQRPSLADVWVENQLGAAFVQRSMPPLPLGITLNNSAIEALDFNGDGILDLVKKEFDNGKHDLLVYYGLGSGGYWQAPQTFIAPPASPREVFLADVNRDGQTDIVRVSGSWVAYHLNDGSGSFGTTDGSFYGMPETSRTKKLFFADMNGNGSADVVWLTVDGQLDYLDLMEEPNVGLLSRVDNGMGLVTDISYRTSTDYAIDSKLRGTPWKTPLPHPVPVISEVASRDSLESLGAPGWESRTSYDYADGYFDTKEREFRGFAQVTMTEWGGDALQEGKLTELHMHIGRNLVTGADEESLKGKVWLEVTKTDLGAVLSSKEARWEQRWLCQEDPGVGAQGVLPSCAGITDKSARKDDLVGFAVQTGTLSGSWERQASARFVASETAVNPWGKPTRLTEYGEVTFPGGHQLGQPWSPTGFGAGTWDDEKVTETDYANAIDLSTSTWLIGYPIEQRSKTLAGVVVTQSRTLYDGPEDGNFTGLALGQVQRGLVRKQLSWLAQESRWVPVKRTGYNSEGLPTQQVDATGVTTNVVYDPLQSRFFPTQESLALEGGRTAVFSADYDRGYGAITSLTDANSKKTRFKYDDLGRLVQVVDPLGSDAEPLISYAYQYGTSANPISSTTIKQLAERGRRVYRTSVMYSDGLGRSRLTKTQTDTGFVGSGWHVVSALGTTVRESRAFSSSSIGFEVAPLSTPEVVTRADALGRPLREDLPLTPEQGASFRIFKYLPLETRTYDERDSTQGTLAFPDITRLDGLGRTREAEKKNAVGAQTTQTTTLKWSFAYDIVGRLTTLKDPQLGSRNYGYDSLGRLRSLTDPNLGSVQMSYDDASRPIKHTDALGQEIDSDYGASSGRLVHQQLQTRDAQNALRVDAQYFYHYDEPLAGGPLAQAANLIGRVSWIESPIGTDHFSYDERGQPVSQAAVLWDGTSPFASQVRTAQIANLQYNPAGQITRRELPGAFAANTSYDARGLVKQLNAGLPSDTRDVVTGALYDEQGMPTQVDQGNGVRQCNRYNARSQLTGVVLGKNSAVSCSAGDFNQASFGAYHVAYGWGYDGTLSSVADRSVAVTAVPRRDSTYSYDRLNQLITAGTTSGNFGYTYDTIQNLTLVTKQQGTAPAVQQVLTYGEQAGPNAVTHQGATALTYDSVGQLKAYNGYDLKFDALGRLTQASKPGAKTLQYFYDALGERRLLIAANTGGIKDVYRYPFGDYEERAGDAVWRVSGADPDVDVELHQANGLRVDAALLDDLTSYVNAPQGKPKPLPAEWLDLSGDGRGFDAADLAVAQQAFWTGTPAGGTRIERRYVQRDLITSSVLGTDSAGDAVSARQYEPYGTTAQRSGVQPTRGYTGAEIEPVEGLGMIRMGARYYAPGLGRWATPDRYIGESPTLMPSRLLEANLYSYATNSPVTRLDPNGSDPSDAWYVRIGKVAAGVGYGTLQAVTPGGFIVDTAATPSKDVDFLAGKGAANIAGGVVEIVGGGGAVATGAIAELPSFGASTLVVAGGAVVVAEGVANVATGLNAIAVAIKGGKLGGGKTYETYTKDNPATGEVYSGRTRGTGTPEQNVARRDAGHHKNGEGFGPAQLDKSSSNPDAIRGREQQLIDANGGAKSKGGTSGNAINGVSPSNPKAPGYADAASKEF